MNTKQERAAFEAWARKELRIPFGMELNWDNEIVQSEWRGWQARAALQSKDREDAERYRYLSSMATQQADALGPIFRIDVRRTPQTLFNFDAAVDHARRIDGGGE